MTILEINYRTCIWYTTGTILSIATCCSRTYDIHEYKYVCIWLNGYFFLDIQLVRDDTATNVLYKPIIFPNDFWHLRSQYIEINETTPTLPLQIVFQPMSYFKFQLFASMGHGFSEAAKQQGQGSGAEVDEIKRMLVETNPYFLGLTGVVSILHVMSVYYILGLKFFDHSFLDLRC